MGLPRPLPANMPEADATRASRKRPSVISATFWPMSWPKIIDVGESISGMPGPPLGPSDSGSPPTRPFDPPRKSFKGLSWELNTTAGPSWRVMPGPPRSVFSTAPSGARLPARTASLPWAA